MLDTAGLSDIAMPDAELVKFMNSMLLPLSRHSCLLKRSSYGSKSVAERYSFPGAVSSSKQGRWVLAGPKFLFFPSTTSAELSKSGEPAFGIRLYSKGVCVVSILEADGILRLTRR